MKYMKLNMVAAQKLVDYLVTKPWAEVNELLVMVRQSEIMEEKETADGDRGVDDEAGSSESDSESS